MSPTAGEAILRELLMRVANRDATNVGLDDDLVEELALDSLTSLRLLAAVEKQFRVRFPDEQLQDFRSLRRILELVDVQRKDKEP